MKNGTGFQLGPPVIAGSVTLLISWSLFEYWEASRPYFAPLSSNLLMTAAIGTTLFMLACWVLACRIMAMGRGLDERWMFAGLLGPLGLGIIALLKDRAPADRRYTMLRRHRREIKERRWKAS